ncbi:MAG: hypothetical protein NC419_12170 [Muribaculaceae bacterium]|nr:hypothetical protein [Muribaculaceae bacterium]
MHQRREDLDILFRRTPPEIVLESIRSGNVFWERKKWTVDAQQYPCEAYDRYSLLNLPEYSSTELKLRTDALQESIKEIAHGGVFSLLVLYADEVFHYDGIELTCRLDQILNWRSIYLRLGQDIFTTAWFAWRDRYESFEKTADHKFTWRTIIGTDDKKLNKILEEGLAENHYHLNGSTQSFSLSWACLMNHPARIHKFLHDKPIIQKDLNYHASSGADDNVLDWETRVLYAAMIRALLFERCLGLLEGWKETQERERQDVSTLFRAFDAFPSIAETDNHIEMLRQIYGKRYEQMNGKKVCLDYANCARLYRTDEKENNRLLAGERCFLYQCFRRQFRGEFSRSESDLFYLYLLIKSGLRGELIQINDRYGFQNFADYQDRKNAVYEGYDEYWTESLRLSVCSGIEENHLVSLEARIMSGNSAPQLRRRVTDLDRRIEFSARKEEKDSLNMEAESDEETDKKPPLWFYVIHFPKSPFQKEEYEDDVLHLHPRNWKTRRKARIQAKAVSEYISSCNTENQRVWGMDACSMEIGCRPETFATEIRYLRAVSGKSREQKWYCSQENLHKEIGVTYHVGEDFLDIADGLRAVDETLQFLDFRKGDRIGHGLALGIVPEEYYQTKKYNIFLHKQDYLDNLVWILYRSLELGVVIAENHRAVITNKAMELLGEIYPMLLKDSYSGNLLDLYYKSWKLRGDHPDLYINGKFETENAFREEEYDNFKVPGGLERYKAKVDELSICRKDPRITKMYYLYHFDNDAKTKGLQSVGIKIPKWYIDAMKDMQQAMRMEVFKKGVCIECNPSSNALIGTFKKYIGHPVLVFNQHHLGENNQYPDIQVSINTDDIGVFDTSLENEYAMMLHAICRSRHEMGNYKDEAVYEYLDYLRLSGIHMSFRE